MKKLYRSKTNKTLFGVCGGIAECLEIDATIIRILVVAITLLTRAIIPALILYIVCALIIPSDNMPTKS